MSTPPSAPEHPAITKRGELLIKLGYSNSLRESYVNIWGFDPENDLKPTTGGTFAYEAHFPLTQDPPLGDAGISVIARVEVGQDGTSKNRIVLVAKDGREASITCSHTVVYDVPPPESPTRAVEQGSFQMRSTEQRPGFLRPWDHFAALKSFVGALADCGFATMIFAGLDAESQGMDTTGVGVNSYLRKQIIESLGNLGGDILPKFRADFLDYVLDTTPAEWIAVNFNRLDEIVAFHYTLENNQRWSTSDAGAARRKTLSHALSLAVEKSPGVIQYLTWTTQLESENEGAWINLAREKVASKTYAEAAAACEHALQISPNNALTLTILGDAHFERAWEVQENAQAIQQSYAAAVSAYERALELNSALAVPWFRLGMSRFFLGKFHDASSAYERAVALDEGKSFPWGALGAARLKLGNFPGAAEASLRAVTISPDNATAWANLAAARYHLGDFKGFQEACVKGLGFKQLRLVRHQLVQIDFDGTIATCQAAAKEMPTFLPARGLRRMLHIASGDNAGAIAALEELVKMAPPAGDDWLLLGQSGHDAGDFLLAAVGFWKAQQGTLADHHSEELTTKLRNTLSDLIHPSVVEKKYNPPLNMLQEAWESLARDLIRGWSPDSDTAAATFRALGIDIYSDFHFNTAGHFQYEARFPLAEDPSLQAAGVEIVIRTTVLLRLHVTNEILLANATNESQIDKLRTLVYVIPPNTNAGQAPSEDSLPTEHSPATFPPWEHFFSAKSYGAALAEFGILNLLTGALIPAADNPAWPFQGQDCSDLVRHVLEALKTIAPPPSLVPITREFLQLLPTISRIEKSKRSLGWYLKGLPLKDLVEDMLPHLSQLSDPTLREWIGDIFTNKVQDLLNKDQKNWTEISATCERALQFLPNRVDLWGDLGWARGSLGDLPGSIDALKKGVELNPKNHQIWFNLGLSQIKKGNFTEAVAAYEKAVELEPSDPASWHNLGSARSHLKDFAGVLKAAEKEASLNPNKGGGWAMISSARSNLKDHAGALAAGEKAVEVEPKSPLAWVMLSSARGNLKDHAGALAAAEKAVTLDPKYSFAWMSLCFARGNLKDHAGAIAAGEKAVELDPRRIESWTHLGIARTNAKDYTGATTAFEKVLEIDPTNAIAWINIGVVYEKIKDIPKSAAAGEKAVELDPSNATAWSNLGISRGKLGNHEGSLQAYQRSLELDPRFPNTWVNLGYLFHQLHDYATAIRLTEHAIKFEEKNATAWGNLSAYRARVQDVSGSLEASERAFNINPEDTGQWHGLALAKLADGDVLGGIVVILHTIRLDPSNAESWNILGELHQAQGHLPAALRAYRRALTLSPYLYDVWERIAGAYDAHKDTTEALQAREEVVRRKPGLNIQAAFKDLVKSPIPPP